MKCSVLLVPLLAALVWKWSGVIHQESRSILPRFIMLCTPPSFARFVPRPYNAILFASLKVAHDLIASGEG
jgi:hypothetical protein